MTDKQLRARNRAKARKQGASHLFEGKDAQRTIFGTVEYLAPRKRAQEARHALSIQGQSEHERGRAIVPAQPTPDSGGTPALDPFGMAGEQGPPGADAHAPASDAQETTSHAVLASPQSQNDAPAVEVVKVKAPRRARP